VRINAAGLEPSDDAFSIEPGRGRELTLRAAGVLPERLSASITALNLTGRLVVTEKPA
jgi:hypothetical protein